MAQAVPGETGTLAGTGIEGFDDILGGGYTKNRLYLIDGIPGSGKTTFALHFLLEGARRGEQGLYVTLSETKTELEGVAESHGWSLDKIKVCELVPSDEQLLPDAEPRMFHLSEMELADTTRAILQEVERIKPKRVVFDSLSEMRLLAHNPIRYRRQILGLKHFFVGRDCTVLLLDDRTAVESDVQLHSLAHGVVSLEHLAHEYGGARRRLRIMKMRGKVFRGGYHDFRIRRGGIDVFPRLVAAEHRALPSKELLSSGVPQLDSLLGGGIDRGTSVLLMGPAGTGKSSISTQYVVEAAARGERSAMFLFDESEATLRKRSAGMQMDIRPAIDGKFVSIQRVDPAELAPGEFIAAVRQAVKDGARIIVIDSLNGYMNAMPDERHLTLQLHELLTFLSEQGVVTFLVVAQHGLIGSGMAAPVDTSYLADTVVMIRYFEVTGKLRRAISVVKKRSGGHETTLREFTMNDHGLQIGEPMHEFHGILQGVPTLLNQRSGS